jgi:Leucine-rich repeat (LRR) protein
MRLRQFPDRLKRSAIYLISGLLFTIFLVGCEKTTPKKNASNSASERKTPSLKKGKDGEVTSAQFDHSEITPDAITTLQKHRNLKELTFFECPRLDQKVIDQLVSLKSLESLYFVRCPINDDDIQSMGKLSQIKMLALTHTKVTKKGIASLENWKKLNCLTIGIGFTAETLTPLPKLTNLTCLELRFKSARISQLKGLGNLSNLETLRIYDADITDDDLAALPKLDRLTEFKFDPRNITNAGVAHLANVPKLRKLSLTSLEITDAGLAHLVNLPELKELSLAGSSVTNQGLTLLLQLKQLESLDLAGCKRITKEGVKHIAKIRHLKRVNFLESGVDGGGLQALVNSKELRSVSIAMERSTVEQVNQLKAALPNCEVIRIRMTPPSGAAARN